MRLPYTPLDPTPSNPQDDAIISRVRQRRGGTLIELDRTLLHAPPIADGWNSFLLSIRTQSTLPTSVRETAICRVAVLNQAWYEWDHHLPILLQTVETEGFPEKGADYILKAPRGEAGGAKEALNGGGMSGTGSKTMDEVVEVVGGIAQATKDLLPQQITGTGAAFEAGGLDERHLAVLAYVDAMTVSVAVPDAIFERLRQHFNDREVVEITATIAAYNCVSRFLVALDVGEKEGQRPLDT
jgi:alkylhydroperoxidase family enzyme